MSSRSHVALPQQHQSMVSETQQEARAIETAMALVRKGSLSKARQVLSSRGLAPGTAETLAELRDPARRPEQLSVPLPQVDPPGARQHAPLDLDRNLWAQCLRSAPKGSSCSLSGASFEMLKISLDDEETLDLQASVAERFARGDVPSPIARGLGMGRLTALQKDTGRVRGIVAGDAFRRLVAKALSRQFGDEIEDACAPFQYALSTRAGTDCAAHLLRAATDGDARATVVSIDGIGAFDHIRRANIIGKLQSLPSASALVPFVMLSYGQPSTYLWADSSGVVHDIRQGEGGEQGDPLMPALYALAQHGALQAAHDQLQSDEVLLAYLDDVYVLCRPERAAAVFNIVTTALREHAGINANLGKCRVWNRGGILPDNISHVGSDVWVGGSDTPEDRNGVVVLGTPLGSPAFVQRHSRERLQQEQTFLKALRQMPDLQCAWNLLTYCAIPRSNHTLRTLPPSLSEEYARGHDAAVQDTLRALLSTTFDHSEQQRLRSISSLPTRLGGGGLRSAVRTATAAYWASWADALPMMLRRNRALAQQFCDRLNSGTPGEAACLNEAIACRDTLMSEGYSHCPTWDAILAGTRPHQPEAPDPGEFRHGWQFYASSYRESHFRESIRLSFDAASWTLLESQSGCCSGRHLALIPISPESTFTSERFRTLLQRRFRLPLDLVAHRCNGQSCRRHLDIFGDHRASCGRSGRLKKRSGPVEKMWARVCREAGARVQENVFLRDMNLFGINSTDGRRLEVVVNGTPLYHGRQIAIDATIVSPLRADGSPHSTTPGAALRAAYRRKLRAYPELRQSERCHLLVAAVETGGRWDEEAYKALVCLAKAKARSVPAVLRSAMTGALLHRWTGMLAFAIQDALAATLVEDMPAATVATDGPMPEWGVLLGELGHC